MVQPYLQALEKLTIDYPIKTAVDLGCGDFAVGSKVYELFDVYTACDISSLILERNKVLYKSSNLRFQKVNLAKDDLPAADVFFVRQVLQHLSNKEIKLFVMKVNESKNCNFLVVTEHLPISSNFQPNLDKPSGPNTRLSVNSGVVLHNPPFSLQYKECHDICCVEAEAGGRKAVIRSTLYIL